MRVVIDLQGDPRILEVSAHTEAATLADLVECAYDTPPPLDCALWVDDVRHEPDTLLSDLTLLEGSRVGDTPVAAPRPLSGWTLTELGGGGPGASCTVPAEGVVTIGRSPQADLTVDSASASWLHATVQAEGEGLRVKDRGSTNGTRLGGRDLDEQGELVTADAVLRMGSYRSVLTYIKTALVLFKY